MRLRPKRAIAVAAIGGALLLVIAAWSAFAWVQLDTGEREAIASVIARRPVLPVVLAAMLALAVHALVARFFAAYPRAARRLAAETRVVLDANPGHRVEAHGGAEEMVALAREIEALADRHRRVREEVEGRVAAARAELAEERNRLAALVSELAQGVVVVNAEGRILLYNQRARHILGAPEDADDGGIVGLGRSLGAILDSAAVGHAVEGVRRRLERGESGPVERFVTHTRAGLLLRVHLAPVVDGAGGIDGYVYTIEDATRRIAAERGRDSLVRSLTEGIRGPVANLRAAIETIDAAPAMETEQLRRFHRVIREEALALSDHLEATVARHAEHLATEWPLEEILASDLLGALERSLRTWAGVATRVRHAGDPLWLRADGHALVVALTRLVRRIRDADAVEEVTLDLERADRFARLDLVWSGSGVDGATLARWYREPLADEGYGATVTLGEVIDHHGATAWSQRDRTTGRAFFRLFLPCTSGGAHPGHTPRITVGSRPEFYDFDLFATSAPGAEIEDASLRELVYTAFDTETTGLDPSAGDEIIAVGAVRIVNGRVLREEIFDQRINPRRRVSPEAQAVHGISSEMLGEEPPLEVVLPRFHRFAEGAVLIAHNAAFDMRFLELAEARARVRFAQPVLDTLLLSAVVHPEHDDHGLDAIAGRLGVPVIGRHTSLGDALITAQIFLRMLPLLAAQGITTLREARDASQRTMLARVRY